jgi:four helix bundle protein
MKSYRDLEIFQLSYDLAVKVHYLTLKLPKYELYEEGSQIRRSSKSICSNIVEGFGRRKYQADFIKFLISAHASCDETLIHLRFIYDSKYIDEQSYISFKNEYEELSKKINKFINYVEENWKSF